MSIENTNTPVFAAQALRINQLSLAEAALTYASAGISVFPLVPNQKIPFAGFTWREKATTDFAIVKEWWELSPRANIALITGGDFTVVDVDLKNEAPGIATYERLAEAGLMNNAYALATTPSEGFHLIVNGGDIGCPKALSQFGVDVKGQGGYVVGAPSKTDSGVYKWEEVDSARYSVTPWDHEAAKSLIVPAKPKPENTQTAVKGAWGGLAKKVRTAKEGTRNDVLYWAACVVLEEGGEPSFLVEHAEVAGLANSEAERTIRSAVTAKAVA